NVGLSIGTVDKSAIDEKVRTQIGDKPVIELKLKSKEGTISWNNPDAPVTVSIPYTPTEKELSDPEHITVWYIDGEGNVIEVPTGRYNPVTGMVTFSTTHFSNYAVVYVTKTFDDLENAAWGKKSIEVLASKGVMKGVSEKEFEPQSNITRADFLYSLIRTLGVEARFDGNFDDISKDDYYYKEIGIAQRMGITKGTGNNKFNPEESITRQDMMVLTERALRMFKRIEAQGAASDLDKFADKSLIADYAVNSVASVVKEGLIVGSGDGVNPLGNTTRAETAVFLYRIYNK
ncbi:MAG TPA: S-layer homology domain-containing protein, partial [Sedimentibacter sp.]|nr:S-layer homology domain-containing protein [Sedimentibacter sp.]